MYYMMLFNKKGMIMSWADMFKGLLVGLILGAVIVYLMRKGIIPINLP